MKENYNFYIDNKLGNFKAKVKKNNSERFQTSPFFYFLTNKSDDDFNNLYFFEQN